MPRKPSKPAVVAGIAITNPERVVFPGTALTKLDVALYHEAVARYMLPHVLYRPLMVLRCPDGAGGERFFQKHIGPGMPVEVGALPVHGDPRRRHHIVLDDLSGVIALVQLGSLEIHCWNAPAGRIEAPDRMVLDLDPGPDVPWSRVVDGARRLRVLLESLGLRPWLKTSGKGLHIVTELPEGTTWPALRRLAQLIARRIQHDDPRHFTTAVSPSARTGRIFVDWLRNNRGATAVAAWSTRARPGGLVSAPITWKDLDDGLEPADVTIPWVLARLARGTPDPWRALTAKARRAVPKVRPGHGERPAATASR